MSYYSPYSQWPAGFQIHFSDYLLAQIRFSSSSLSPKYMPTVDAIHFSNYIIADINIQGGKQSDDTRPIATTIIS